MGDIATTTIEKQLFAPDDVTDAVSGSSFVPKVFLATHLTVGRTRLQEETNLSASQFGPDIFFERY
jgi:hypothetical protein